MDLLRWVPHHRAMQRSAKRADDAPAGHDTARTVYLVRRVQQETFLRLEAALQPLDVTTTQYTVLSLLARSPSLSSAELSRKFSVTPQTMIKLVSSLESKGLIARTGEGGDRRALAIRLTPAGKRVLARCDRAVDAVEDRLLDILGEGELASLRHALSRLLKELHRPARDPAAAGEKPLDQPG
ncbi:MarR family winged helix-turn-helix transcriptional regulator [Roseomonas sp. BN140053]|uniref:MarR family winged helix-turn-helix transcriptional regulator n=1 Tax=Roseomonas sp. BN140053 TaxID=3391898 RepID=UPI0039EA90F1